MPLDESQFEFGDPPPSRRPRKIIPDEDLALMVRIARGRPGHWVSPGVEFTYSSLSGRLSRLRRDSPGLETSIRIRPDTDPKMCRVYLRYTPPKEQTDGGQTAPPADQSAADVPGVGPADGGGQGPDRP